MIDVVQVEVDAFLMGIGGGFFAFVLIWSLAWGYLRYSLHRQVKVIREFRKAVNMMALSKELEELKDEVLIIRKFLGGVK